MKQEGPPARMASAYRERLCAQRIPVGQSLFRVRVEAPPAGVRVYVVTRSLPRARGGTHPGPRGNRLPAVSSACAWRHRTAPVRPLRPRCAR